MKHCTEEPGLRSGSLSRREVLALGSAAAVGGLLAEAPAWASEVGPQVQRIVQAPAAPLSVGFLEGSEGRPRFLPWKHKGGGRVVPAAEMPIGDQGLAGETVLMTVHGLYPRLPPNRFRSFQSLDLVVWVESQDPALPGLVPFIAWGGRRKPQRNLGQRLRFPVGLPADGGLELTVEVRWESDQPGGALVEVPYGTRFTVDWTPGSPRLQQGVYLLGVGEGVWTKASRLPRAGEALRDELCSLAVSFESPLWQ
ncbi:MAG TPA: hypothetical protein PK413_01270 [Thermoanaerobaculia bacterium]|nr:hypothetical protein [Thermoanaerobaculia bacterium]